ncbi:MAG TPA: hypothetical protein VGQ83_30895 [Polyangia bacterium]
MRGQVPDQALSLAADKGMYYGFAELRLRFAPVVHLDLKPILGATQKGFDGGLGTALHLGRLAGTQVSLGLEYIHGIGATGSFRLGWRTIPRFPMGFTLELSDFPGESDVALRAVYDVTYAPSEWLALTLRVGYQARDYTLGGPMGGLAATFSF